MLYIRNKQEVGEGREEKRREGKLGVGEVGS